MRSERWNPLLKTYPDSDKVNAVSIGAESPSGTTAAAPLMFTPCGTRSART